jgi:hypothetical protein
MSTYKNAKTMAKSLRAALDHHNISLSHSTCLEIIARQFGFNNWNTLSAKLSPEEETHVQSQDHKNTKESDEKSQTPVTMTPWSACSFCGKSAKEVRSLVGGCGGWEAFRAARGPERSNVFICDECANSIAQHFASTFGTATAKESPAT